MEHFFIKQLLLKGVVKDYEIVFSPVSTSSQGLFLRVKLRCLNS